MLHETEDIHVALHDDGAISLADVVARRAQPVQNRALVIYGSLGRVEIFRLVIRCERAGAEPDGSVGQIGDGEDEAISKAIVMTGAPAARQCQSGLLKELGFETAAIRHWEEVRPSARGIAEGEAIDRLVRDAAPAKVTQRRGSHLLT